MIQEIAARTDLIGATVSAIFLATAEEEIVILSPELTLDIRASPPFSSCYICVSLILEGVVLLKHMAIVFAVLILGETEGADIEGSFVALGAVVVGAFGNESLT